MVVSGLRWNRVWVLSLALCVVFSAGCRRKRYENPITKDTQQPDKVLFDKAIKDIEKGRYEVARLTLNTLMNTYDTSEFLAKAKLAIADSWYREGGSHGWAQAEAEYKDFILFYPTLEESAEAQSRICNLHYRQMEKPDRDPTHMMRAEEECRQVLTQFPNSRFAPEAAQRLRQIQEVIAESEFRVGTYYHAKQSYPAAANRLSAMTDHYKLYSKADVALWKQGESYEKMGPRFKEQATSAYSKIVREYPLSGLVEDAKKKLTGMEVAIPEADPVAYARQKYEIENATERGMWGKFWGILSKSPDTSQAAKSGQPPMTAFRPTIPASVPIPGATAATSSDVTVGEVPAGSTSALDTQPDARQSRQNQGAGTAAPGNPQPQQPPAAEAKKQDNRKKKDSKKEKK